MNPPSIGAGPMTRRMRFRSRERACRRRRRSPSHGGASQVSTSRRCAGHVGDGEQAPRCPASSARSRGRRRWRAGRASARRGEPSGAAPAPAPRCARRRAGRAASWRGNWRWRGRRSPLPPASRRAMVSSSSRARQPEAGARNPGGRCGRDRPSRSAVYRSSARRGIDPVHPNRRRSPRRAHQWAGRTRRDRRRRPRACRFPRGRIGHDDAGEGPHAGTAARPRAPRPISSPAARPTMAGAENAPARVVTTLMRPAVCALGLRAVVVGEAASAAPRSPRMAGARLAPRSSPTWASSGSV